MACLLPPIRRMLRCLVPLLSAAVGLPAFADAQTLSGASVASPLLLPVGVAFDSAGALYVAEIGAHRIRKIDAQGRVTAIAGDGTEGFAGDGGPATSAEMDAPAAIAIDGSDNLYVCDSHNHRVRRIDAKSGVITTVAGSGASGFAGDGALATSATLDLPVGLALDPAGNLWIADAREHRVRRVDAASGTIQTVAGTGAEGYSGDGASATAAMIDTPTAVAADSSGNVFLADAHNGRVRRIDAATGVITTVAGSGSASGAPSLGASAIGTRLILPRGLALDAAGRLYLADAGAQNVLAIDTSAGTVHVVAGSGAEGNTGDMADPLTATVDGPRATAIAPGGLLTIADTENGRVRLVTSAPILETIAGIGAVPGLGGSGLASTSIALSAASSATYGAATTITATLTTTGSAGGSISLLDGSVVTLTQQVVAGSTSSFSIASISAGTHRLSVSYSGDTTHAAAVSPAVSVAIAPAVLSVTANSASSTYGATLPSLTGSVSGLLPQDASRVALQFATIATQTSPVGSYPITASITGAAAGNYALQATSATLTVSKAGTVSSVSHVAVASSGSVLTATLTVQSATTGQPTGSVTLLDGGTPIAATSLGNGAATLSSGSLASGTHVLTVFYSGDANFLSSTSAGVPVTLGSSTPSPSPTSDFALSATGASTQTVLAGASANFNLWAQWTGATMSSPVTLSVSGLPAFGTASFNPAYLPPGGAVSAFTLTVTTPAQQAMGVGATGAGAAAAAFCLSIPLVLLRRPRGGWAIGQRCAWVMLVSAGILCAAGCGDRVRSPADTGGVTSKSYPLTVTGTATNADGTTLQHTVVVTLVVQTPGS